MAGSTSETQRAKTSLAPKPKIDHSFQQSGHSDSKIFSLKTLLKRWEIN